MFYEARGIDAPERDQLYGPVATAALEYMVGRACSFAGGATPAYKKWISLLRLSDFNDFESLLGHTPIENNIIGVSRYNSVRNPDFS